MLKDKKKFKQLFIKVQRKNEKLFILLLLICENLKIITLLPHFLI